MDSGVLTLACDPSKLLVLVGLTCERGSGDEVVTACQVEANSNYVVSADKGDRSFLRPSSGCLLVVDRRTGLEGWAFPCWVHSSLQQTRSCDPGSAERATQ